MRFDILFDGTLKPDADPTTARQRLGAAFKLDAAGVERLFGGKPVMLKRDADATTAARYKRVFDESGAILRLDPVRQPTDATADAARIEPSTAADSVEPTAPGALSLAPPGGFLVETPPVKMRDFDTSHLSLVPGPDWSLADCESTATETRLPDTSHLSLAAIEPSADDNDQLG
jgi:hypothetical protein